MKTRNEFFQTLRGAKTAGSRRGLADGARIVDTSEGFCLLELGEGCDEASYNAIRNGRLVCALEDGKWSEAAAQWSSNALGF